MSPNRNRLRRSAVLVAAAVALSGCVSPDPSNDASPSAQTYNTADVVTCDPAGEAGVGPDQGGLPDLSLPCLGEGPDVSLSHLAGRPTLINLWASWCGPCREEMPLLQDAFEQHGEQIRFLGIVTRDKPSVARDFASTVGAKYPHAVDTAGALLDTLGVPGLPVTLAVDANGRIVAKKIGQMDASALAALVNALTEAHPTDGPTR